MMYKQITCAVIGFCVCISFLSAQDSSHTVRLPISTSGNLFYDFPQSFGAAARMEFPFSFRHIFINKKSKQKQKFREAVTSSTIGFYRYAFNNTGLFIQQSVGFRYYKTKPYYFQWQLMAGALRTFYDGTVYSVNNNGAVNTLRGFGRWYMLTGFATAFGHDWQRNKKPKPFSVAIEPSLWMQFPYNSFVLPHLSLQLSFQYHFSSVTILQKEIKRGHRL